MSKFSERLNIAMQKRNMKPIELSKRTGIDKGSISSYLTGRYEPKPKYICKMAEVLDVSPTWLLGYDDLMDTVTASNNPNIIDVNLENGGVIKINRNWNITAREITKVNNVMLDILTEHEHSKKDNP